MENDAAYLKSIHKNKKDHKKLNLNILINLNGKVYFIKSSKKISRVMKIIQKQEKDEEYLIKLCNSLKIMKPKHKTKKSIYCLYSNLSKSKEKVTRNDSFHLSKKHLKNKKRNFSTTKHLDEINNKNDKINKIKPFHEKSTKKNNYNTNNINMDSRK